MLKTFIALFAIIILPSYGFSAEIEVWGNLIYNIPNYVDTNLYPLPKVNKIKVKCGQDEYSTKPFKQKYDIKIPGQKECRITFIHSFGKKSFKIISTNRSKRFDVQIIPIITYDLKRK